MNLFKYFHEQMKNQCDSLEYAISYLFESFFDGFLISFISIYSNAIPNHLATNNKKVILTAFSEEFFVGDAGKEISNVNLPKPIEKHISISFQMEINSLGERVIS